MRDAKSQSLLTRMVLCHRIILSARKQKELIGKCRFRIYTNITLYDANKLLEIKSFGWRSNWKNSQDATNGKYILHGTYTLLIYWPGSPRTLKTADRSSYATKALEAGNRASWNLHTFSTLPRGNLLAKYTPDSLRSNQYQKVCERSAKSKYYGYADM